MTLGAKGHYYPHGVEWQKLWQMSLGYADEESVEKFHKECTAVFLSYESQRGLLKITYAMDHLLLIRSLEYAQWFVILCVFLYFCLLLIKTYIVSWD